MSERWLEILDPEVDATIYADKVRRRIAGRSERRAGDPDPASVAEALFEERFLRAWDQPASDDIGTLVRDCDVVPTNYVIDWRVPVLGPIHAAIRRVIHAEMRRYLLQALQKQSHLNRRMLKELETLQEEHDQLRKELERIAGGQGRAASL